MPMSRALIDEIVCRCPADAKFNFLTFSINIATSSSAACRHAASGASTDANGLF